MLKQIFNAKLFYAFPWPLYKGLSGYYFLLFRTDKRRRRSCDLQNVSSCGEHNQFIYKCEMDHYLSGLSLQWKTINFPFLECPKSSLTIGSIRSLYNGNIVAVWCDRRHAIGTLGYNVADSQARVVKSIYHPLPHTDRETLFTCKSSEKRTAARPHRGEVSRSLSLKCSVSKTTEKPGQRLPVLMAILRKLSMPWPGSCW